MGWHRTHTLEVEEAEYAAKECGLWTRGGLEGLEVHIGRQIIHIPREAILELVSAEYVSRAISRLEQLSTEDAIAEIFGRKPDA